jgi:hypothetical protein
VKKTIVDAGNPGPGLGRAQKCVEKIHLYRQWVKVLEMEKKIDRYTCIVSN